MEKKYSFYNILFGWLAFVGASIVYLLTMEPTVSLWDCGEFIATAAKLEVGHPPGAPLFLMLGRFFALFVGNDTSLIAASVNAMSALASGATIMFLFWTITHLAKKFFVKNELKLENVIAIIGAGIIGAGAYAFTDTFWFSAVEGEVYALSSLFTAVVFWLILKWENVAHKPNSDRWIILIAYIMGLSIGVHLLNLLTITAIVYVYYFKKYKPTTKGFILAGLLSLVLIAFMMWGVIAGSVQVASQFELFFINILGMPFHSGLVIYLIFLVAAIVAGVIFTRKDSVSVEIKTAVITVITVLIGLPFISSNPLMWIIITAGIAGLVYYIAKKDKFALNTIVNVIAVVMIGYSSYAMIMVRSQAETPMNENAPNNAFALLSYLNREQYGQTPLVYGPYYNAAPNWQKDGTAEVEEKFTYTPLGDKYVKVNNGIKYVWADEFCTIFPRMHSNEAHHVQAYKEWAGIKDGVNTNQVFYDKERKNYDVPTFGQNLKFFFSYQIGHMYMRYFMWNFAGRQNDVQTHGEITNGNWITGIDAIDNVLVGNQEKISDKAKNDPTRNVYYLLPFILGLFGLIFHVGHDKKDSFVVFLLFILTGLAIVVYLNQTPYQPRERDYAYAGSFYAFCIWIGISVIGFYHYGKKYLKNGKIAAVLAILIALPTPIVLAVENWDDHDRSGRYTALEFARSYLETCDPNSIIVTAGDNDTFPLWYAQEVEGIRTDVRVVCTPLLSTDWYSQQMMRRTYESAPLPTKLTPEQVAKGVRDVVRVNENLNVTKGNYIDISQAMEIVRDDNMFVDYYGDKYNYMPARKLKFKVDKEKVLANGIVAAKDTSLIVDEIRFEVTKSERDKSIYKNKLIFLDILDGYQWDRPIYFTNPMTADDLGLAEYIRYDGFAYKFVPIVSKDARIPYADTDVMYENLMNKYQWGGMGDSTVHMNHFNQRTTRVIGVRAMYNQLALMLGSEGKKEKAKEVLLRLKQIMPDSQFPYMDDNIVTTAYAYYSIDENELANEELLIYAMNLIDELEWFSSLSVEHKKRVTSDEQNYLSSVVRIAEIAYDKQETELLQKLELEWMRVEPGITLQQVIEQQYQQERERLIQQQLQLQQQQLQQIQ